MAIILCCGKKLWIIRITWTLPTSFVVMKKGAPFWKGVLWATKAVKMGYRWEISNGKKVRF
jgi:hypothetical protein